MRNKYLYLNIKSLKRFINFLLIDFSKSFLYSQSSFKDILKDSIISKFRFLSRDFNEVIAQTNISDKEILKLKRDLENGYIRSHINKTVSKAVTYKTIPNFLLKIIDDNKELINAYLGPEVLHEKIVVWRNYHIDPDFEGYDIFSNVWHQDSHDGNRLLKIFVLIDDVSEKDGPFHWLREKDTKKHWDSLFERWGFDNFSGPKYFNSQRKLIGKRGDYLILDTSRCIHRDSNPESTRDIVQITLYPNWRKKSDRKLIKLKI